jgi:hypothetical protein
MGDTEMQNPRPLYGPPEPPVELRRERGCPTGGNGERPMGERGDLGLLTTGRVDRRGGRRKVRKLPIGLEGTMWAVRAEAHDGLIYTLGTFPNRRTAESYKTIAKRWRRFWVEPTSAGRGMEISR